MATKYIFVTGGVVSGLGKGITAASLGRLLKTRGLKVASQKLDPYINVDPGTMSPLQHGEVFVTDDGTETDLDLGHYERFIVKTIIEQLHDRLKDDGISEDLIKHVADRLGHDRRYGIDPTKIKNDLGWYPETPFEKGIVLTIDWYLDHEEWMEHITSGNYQKYYEEMYKNK